MSSNHSILYVEDEPFLGKTLQRMFSDAGFTIDLAKDGEEAIVKAEATPYDLMLLDILLPKADGFEVLKKMKSSEKTKHVPVFVLSNLGSDEDMRRSKELGAVHHFVKVTMDPRKIVAFAKAYLDGPTRVVT